MILRKTHSSRGTVFPKARVIVAGEKTPGDPSPPKSTPVPPRGVGRTLKFSSPTKNYPEKNPHHSLSVQAQGEGSDLEGKNLP